MTTPQHSRLINAAARATLKPLGCVQKGRSRTWLDDHPLWVGVVEFQPSSWSKGSYLNVGACWLWDEKDYLSFDAGYRVGNFVTYQTDEQFVSVAQDLVERASQEVVALRERFASPSQIHAWLMANRSDTIHHHFHLAVSAGLAGAMDQSRRSFADVVSHPEDRPWAARVRLRAGDLLQHLESRDGFENEVMAGVSRTRLLLGLPARHAEAQ